MKAGVKKPDSFSICAYLDALNI